MDHLIKANMSIDKTGGKGTRKGKPNYKSSILLKVVRSILPASKLGWEEVAEDYKLSTKEEDLRGYEDVKRHFIKKMCDSNKKVTGSSAPHTAVLAAQKVYQEILEKEGGGDYGADNQRDDDDDGCDDEDDDNEEFEDEAGNDFDGHKELEEDDEEEPPKKKACATGSSDLKTKNSRPKNPRGAVGGAIVSLVKQMGKNSSNNSMVGMMKMMMQQQQQSNNQMMQMMMMMQARGAQPSHLTYNNALGRNEENYDDDGRYGTPLDSCH